MFISDVSISEISDIKHRIPQTKSNGENMNKICIKTLNYIKKSFENTCTQTSINRNKITIKGFKTWSIG